MNCHFAATHYTTGCNLRSPVSVWLVYFFFPFVLDLDLDADADAVEVTLEAREEGAAELFLLAPLTLSRTLFYCGC